ncbi:MAG: hypothetical protein AAB361_02535 [Patescibacteria group bacterium]
MITKDKLKKLYKSGLSLDKIAKIEKLSRGGVKYWMEKYNIPTRPRHQAGFYGYWGGDKKLPLPKILNTKEVQYLYYKEGLSAEEIAKIFNRSSGGVYRFMRKNGLIRRLPSETNDIKYNKQKLSFTIKNNLSFTDKKLKIAGIMLYWAEGYKNLSKSVRGGTIDLANSDPKMIGVFLKFLREICGIKENKLRVQLYCYANQNVDLLKKFWSELAKIPISQFIKPYVKEDFSADKIDKMKYGLVHIRYSDKKLFLQIKKWTEDYLKSINIK